MQSKILKRIGLFLVFELLAVASAFGIGHRRIQDFLAWFTGWQLIILFFVLLIVWITKHKAKYYQNHTTLTKSGKIKVILATFAIIGLIVGWVMGIFPELVRLSLQHYGVDNVATVQNYELIHQGSRGAEFQATSTSDADALNVKLSYDNRTSTISIQKGDPAFDQVYSAATQTGDSIPVRYLRWIPAIVLPKSDLGLPNSANIKPQRSGSGELPTFSLPSPQASVADVSRATSIANEYLADLQKNDSQAAYSLAIPPFQQAISAQAMLSQYQAFNISNYKGTLQNTGSGTSDYGHPYISLVYKYVDANNPDPFYVKLWVQNYNGTYGVNLLQGDTKPLAAN